MYTVGLDIDTFVSTIIVILWIVLGYMLRNFYNLNKNNLTILNFKQSAGNSESSQFLSNHRPFHKKPFEGNGYFGKNSLQIILYKKNIVLANNLKKWIGFDKIYKDKNAKNFLFFSEDPQRLYA